MFYQFQHFGISEYIQKEYGKNLNFASHLHQAFEFITVRSGEMEITVDSNTYLLQSGQSLLVFPNQIHSISSVESEHMLCIFSPDLVKAYTSKISGKVPLDNRFLPDGFFVKALDSLSADASIAEKKGLFYCLCAEFDKSAAYDTKKTDDKNLLYKIFKFVETNYNKECSLAELAHETGFSYSYLSRYFSKITGISFNSYVNQYRISNACYLLNNSDCPVLQCALDCGYNSLRSFNRNFRELLSVTPNEYRKKNSGC